METCHMPPSNEKKKLCWSCQGNIAMSLNSCPYCGVDLEGEAPEVPVGDEVHKIVDNCLDTSSSKQELIKPDIAPWLLLPGAVFFLFGLALYLFSQEGILTLRWNASYWSYYLVLSLPLLYFGWRQVPSQERFE